MAARFLSVFPYLNGSGATKVDVPSASTTNNPLIGSSGGISPTDNNERKGAIRYGGLGTMRMASIKRTSGVSVYSQDEKPWRLAVRWNPPECSLASTACDAVIFGPVKVL